jgi:hypothetical protein
MCFGAGHERTASEEEALAEQLEMVHSLKIAEDDRRNAIPPYCEGGSASGCAGLYTTLSQITLSCAQARGSGASRLGARHTLTATLEVVAEQLEMVHSLKLTEDDRTKASPPFCDTAQCRVSGSARVGVPPPTQPCERSSAARAPHTSWLGTSAPHWRRGWLRSSWKLCSR